MTQQTRGTYATALRLVLLRNLPRGTDYSAVLRRDAGYMQSGARLKGDGLMWSYLPPPALPAYASKGDYSNLNYAVLGLWAASDLRMEVPQRLWQGLERTWTEGQLPEGGWAYLPLKDFTPKTPEAHRVPRGSMTAAGVASLYVILDQGYAIPGELGAYRKSEAYKSIQKGLKWMADNFDARTNPGRPHFASYYFYNCERVGAAAGLKYFGTHDWFREIGQTLLAAQDPNGAFHCGEPETLGGALVDTSFALMFLAKGSAPVLINKLQHAGDWDNHPRDVAAVTEWFARQFERLGNWQVVNLQVPAEDLSDSRILFVAGTEALSFSEEQRGRLKRYVDLGGLVVFHPDSNAEPFRASVRKFLSDLWPNLELTPVDVASHPLGTCYRPLKSSTRIEQLASPTRVLVLVLDGAPAEAWERRQTSTREDAFDLAANLLCFATDFERADRQPNKLTLFAEPFRRQPGRTDRTVALARIRYGPVEHRWNPEPLAFEAFTRRMAQEGNVACEIKIVAPGDLAASGAKFAHLTGVDAVDFTLMDSAAILAFLKGGGTLIVDQAGGPPHGKRKETFDPAFRRLVDAWYGPGALKPVDGNHPLLTDMENLVYRNVEGRRKRMPTALEHVVQGGRSVLYYSRYDLTCGLLGNPNAMVSGVEPDGCYEILRRLITGVYPPPTSRATAATAPGGG